MPWNPNAKLSMQQEFDAADKEYRDLIAMENQYGGGMLGDNRGINVSAASDRRNALAQALNQQQTAKGGPATGKARVDEARAKMYGLAEGRLGELRNDPVDAQVIKELQNRISGKTNPYDATTRNALLTQQAEMAGQIENNQLARLRSGGGSAADPSYQAAVNEAMAGRQAAAQRANLDINSKANLANYDAKTSAVGGLGSFNMARNQGITGQSNYLGGLYEKETATQETPGAVNNYQLPDFGTWQQWVGQQQNQAPSPAMPMPAPQAQQPQQPARPAQPAQQMQAKPAGAQAQWQGVPYPYPQQAQKPAPAPSAPSYVQLAGQPNTRQQIGGPWQGVPYPYQAPAPQPQQSAFQWKPQF